MKILINRGNPAIRITAPDEMVKNRTNCWAIWSEGDRMMLLDKDNWTLVEGEPEDIEKILELLEKHLELFTAGNLDRRKGYTKHDMQDAFILGFKAGIKRS